MPETARDSVLRRKLCPSRPAKAPGQGPLELLLRKTMPRDADELLGLQIEVVSVAPGRSDKAGLFETLGAFDLIYLMTSDGGSPGICALSPGLLGALTEVQMSGRVLPSNGAERVPTRTDGIVASDLVDRWISAARTEAQAQQLADLLPFCNHFRTNTVLDARNVELALDPCDYMTLCVTLELSGGARTGTIAFAAPLHVGGCAISADTATRFRREVMTSEARISIVLARLPQPILTMRDLKVGDMIEVPIAALESVTLEGEGGEVIATARLGQVGGRKAVRILGKGAAPVRKSGFEFVRSSDGARVAVGSVEGADRGEMGKIGSTSTEPDLPSALVEPPDLPDLSDLPDLTELSDLH